MTRRFSHQYSTLFQEAGFRFPQDAGIVISFNSKDNRHAGTL
jgi:hypothetical protein